MTRLKLAFTLIACVIASLTAPAALAAPVNQAAWTSLKKEVRLSNGIRLAYVELGNPKGQPVLLLHGYTDTSRTWSLVAPYLQDYRLLIPDQRGHGAAEAPACCYGSSQFADDARLFLDAMGVQRAAVAGHSMGSMVAMAMAADYPERVSSITLIGATARVPVKRGDWLFEEVSALRTLDPNSPFMKDWHPANQPTPIDPSFAKFANDELYAIPMHVWRGVMRELAYVPVGRHAADIKAPVLILSGGKDPLFPAEHHASLVAAFPGAEAHVFAELGHNPLWERPAVLGGIIARFLRTRRD